MPRPTNRLFQFIVNSNEVEFVPISQETQGLIHKIRLTNRGTSYVFDNVKPAGSTTREQGVLKKKLGTKEWYFMVYLSNNKLISAILNMYQPNVQAHFQFGKTYFHVDTPLEIEKLSRSEFLEIQPLLNYQFMTSVLKESHLEAARTFLLENGYEKTQSTVETTVIMVDNESQDYLQLFVPEKLDMPSRFGMNSRIIGSAYSIEPKENHIDYRVVVKYANNFTNVTSKTAQFVYQLTKAVRDDSIYFTWPNDCEEYIFKTVMKEEHEIWKRNNIIAKITNVVQRWDGSEETIKFSTINISTPKDCDMNRSAFEQSIRKVIQDGMKLRKVLQDV